VKTRTNPIGIEATGQIAVDLSEQVRVLHRRVVSAESDRTKWIDKQRKLFEQRRGVRRPKVIPWKGANNDHIPLTDGVIRRWKPGIISLVLDADPVCWFYATKPQDVEPAQSAQAAYHWRFHHLPDVVQKTHRLADYIAQYGLAYCRTGWEYVTDQECRILRTNSLFPGGVEAAYKQMSETVHAQNEQAQMQAQQGGAPQQPPIPIPSPEEFVTETVKANYDIDESDMGEDGKPQLESAVQRLMDGAEFIKLYYEAVVHDRPAWEVINPLDVVVPMRAKPTHEQDFIAIVHRLTAEEIAEKTKDGYFIPDAAAIVMEKASEEKTRWAGIENTGFEGHVSLGHRSQLQQSQNRVEGMSPQFGQFEEPAKTPIWEIYTRLNVQGSTRQVILWYAPTSQTLLSVIDYPMPFREWPIVSFEFEHTSDRPYQARSIAEVMSTFQKLVCELHNARLDAIQVILSPMFKWRMPSNELRRNLKFRPGMIIPVSNPDDLNPVVQDFRPLQAFIQEEQLTKALAEQYVGVFDQSLTQVQNPQERRTATEVQAVNQMISSTFTQDAQLFQTSMAMVHKQLWMLWLEFGPEEEYFRVMGEDVPRRVLKKDIDREFDLVPAGTPANTNKSIAMARSREALQFFAPDQTGLVNKRELYKAYFDLTDRNMAKRVLRTEEEAAMFQQIAAAIQESGGTPAPMP
jgi:hypothetical protein